MATETKPNEPVMGTEGEHDFTIEELREQLRIEKEEKERLRVSLKKTSDEDGRKRRRLEEIETEKEKQQAASGTDLERATRERDAERKRADEAEGRYKEAERLRDAQTIDREIERNALKAGFEYPDFAPNLVDRRNISIDEDTGRVVGAKEAVDRLAKERPALLTAKRGGGTPTRDQTPTRPGTTQQTDAPNPPQRRPFGTNTQRM